VEDGAGYRMLCSASVQAVLSLDYLIIGCLFIYLVVIGRGTLPGRPTLRVYDTYCWVTGSFFVFYSIFGDVHLTASENSY
jgi:hypothetical protein